MIPAHIERMATDLHRSGTGRASSDAADLSPRPSGWGIFCQAVSITVQTIGLLTLGALLLFWVVVADALMNPEPQTVTEGCGMEWTADARYVDTCGEGAP